MPHEKYIHFVSRNPQDNISKTNPIEIPEGCVGGWHLLHYLYLGFNDIVL